MFLDAPVPKNKRYHEKTEGLAGDREKNEKTFESRMGSSSIPRNYLDEFQRTLDSLAEWIKSRKLDRDKLDNPGSNNRSARCLHNFLNINFKAVNHIMTLSVGFYDDDEMKGKEIVINYVNTRPCAEGHGFYKIVLYLFIRIAKANPDITHVRVTKCYPENEEILKHYGFIMQDDDSMECKDYVMDKRQMEPVTFERWNMDKLLLPEDASGTVRLNQEALPTAEMLNSKPYVERYALDKNHAEAVRAMRSAPAADDVVPLENAGKRKSRAEDDLSAILRILHDRLGRLELSMTDLVDNSCQK